MPGGVLFGIERLRSVGEVWEGMTHEERREGCRLLFQSVQMDTRGKRLWLEPWPELDGLFAARRRYVFAWHPRQDSGVRSLQQNPRPWLYLPSELGVAV